MIAGLQPYTGTLRKLVLAIDVGTTFSGVGYSILDPGEKPTIQAVTRFPGQENGDFKIPSVLWYTQDGKVRSAGAEARVPGMALVAEDEDLIFVEWFKLHLRPDAMESDGLCKADLKPLPPNKTAVQVFGDFLSYLFGCAKKYIIDTHGATLWSSVEQRIEIVLSHPNGWEGAQQGKMREAAVYAKLVPDTSYGRSRVHFVTEGEASLLYCMNSGLSAHALKKGATVMIVDAGGGTVDLSTYKFGSTTPISVEEIAPAGCIFQGSTRVNMRAHEFLQAKLKNSRYGNPEDLQTMLENFEMSTKPTFKDPSDRSFIKFGSMKDKDPDVGIRSGQIVLEGKEVAQFFEPSISSISTAVRAQRLAASEPVKLAFLVGGFAASPWLFVRLKSVLQTLGMDVSRPDNHTNKAVAEGAVAFFLSDQVAARMARLTYGVECTTSYDESDPEHQIRRHQLVMRPSGNRSVPNAFETLLARGTRVAESKEIRHSFYREASSAHHLNHIHTDITCYRGRVKSPAWTDLEPEFFAPLCSVYANTGQVRKTQLQGLNGVYYKQEYDVVLLCGLTELKAQIAWDEDGVEKRGEAKIVYDDDDEVA